MYGRHVFPYGLPYGSLQGGALGTAQQVFEWGGGGGGPKEERVEEFLFGGGMRGNFILV